MSKERIDTIIDSVLDREKGYVDDPRDTGGETMWGITVAVARAHNYLGTMKDMPVDVARGIYRQTYVSTPNFDVVASIHDGIAAELVDTGVNMGVQTAGIFLQRLLNGLSSDGAAQLKVDGVLGSGTITALKNFLAKRGNDGATVLLRGLNGLQVARYLSITESKPSQRAFLYGWILNRVQ